MWAGTSYDRQRHPTVLGETSYDATPQITASERYYSTICSHWGGGGGEDSPLRHAREQTEMTLGELDSIFRKCRDSN
jgi:hypothetical protein